MDMGCVLEVRSPDDMGDALQGIIMRAGDMIGSRGVLAGEIDIAMKLRAGLYGLSCACQRECLKGELVPLRSEMIAAGCKGKTPGIGFTGVKVAGLIIPM